MGVDDVKKESVQAVLAEELLAGRDIESIDWSKADKRATPEREAQILQLLTRTTNVFSLVHTHENNNTAASSVTPLYLAIVGGYYRVWPYLLQKGANVNQPSLPLDPNITLPQYPFWVACTLKDTALTYTIIQNIVGMFEYGVLPFQYLNGDDWGLFCQLFSRKEFAVVYPKLLQHMSLEILLTKELDNSVVGKLFASAGYGGEKIGWLAMLCAVKSSNVAGIEALLKKGLPAVWPEKFNSFLDIYFSPEGANTLVPEVVEKLVENGCNPIIKSQFGEAVLMKVINSNNTDCLRSMLQGGKKLSSFNIDAKNDKGQTPLFFACQKENPSKEVIKVLLVNGADPNVPAGNEYTRETAVMHCFQHGKLELVLLLLDAGATLDNRSFNIMLDRALQSSDDELLHLVIVAAACAMRCIVESTIAQLNKVRTSTFDIYTASLQAYGTSFLHIACSHGNKSTVIYLLQQNHYVNEKNYRGNIPLHTALHCCNEDIALFLLNNGSDICPNGDGIDALSIACLNDLPEVALWIAKKTGKLRSIVNVGFTSLLACEHVCSEYVRWVIDNCRRSGATSFLDNEFPPTEASLFSTPPSTSPPPLSAHDSWNSNGETALIASPDPIPSPLVSPSLSCTNTSPPSPTTSKKENINPVDHWKPVKRMCFQPSLFSKQIKLGMIEQGNLATCYLLGAVSLLTTRPELLQDMFVMYDLELGIFGIRFFHKLRWTFVVIDGMVPCTKNGKPAFSSSKDPGQTYIMLLEKAYAKLKGTYEAIDGVIGRNIMVELTGGVSKQMKFDLDETSLKEAIRTRSLWKIMQDHHRQGRLMTCQIERPDTPASPLSNGLLVNHLYGILNLTKIDKQHLIQLHNPHLKGEIIGNWNEASAIWAKFPTLENTLVGQQGGGVEGSNDGIFWMCYEDFLQIFNSVDVTHVVYSPKTKYNVGFTQYKNVDIAKGKAFAISSSNVPVQVTIEIRQHINDFLNRDSLAGEEVMLMVCTFDHDSYSVGSEAGGPKSIALHSDLRTARIVERVYPTVDTKFALFFTMWHRHTPYFLVPLAMDKVSHLTCDVGIYTDKPVDHLAVTMLVPFWGGMDVDMDERKKQELMKVKGRVQVARVRARGRGSAANNKHHHRALSANATTASAAVTSSPLFFNPSNPHGLPRSLSHSYSNPVLAVARSRVHASTSPHMPGINSPHSPRSPRSSSPHSPKSPNSPQTVRSPNSPFNTNHHNNNNNRSPTSNNNNNTKGEHRSKYKIKLRQMKQLLKLKDDEITRLKEENVAPKKGANTVSYFDFIPPPIKKGSGK